MVPRVWRVAWEDVAGQGAMPVHFHIKPAVGCIVVLDDVLTRSECQQLIARAESAGFIPSAHQGHVNNGFRRGGRCVLTDGGLAAELFARISRALPPSPYASTDAVAPACGPPAGLWESLRLLSYDRGDFFLPHRDNACEVCKSHTPCTRTRTRTRICK